MQRSLEWIDISGNPLAAPYNTLPADWNTLPLVALKVGQSTSFGSIFLSGVGCDARQAVHRAPGVGLPA
jgi:hypothetical protein